MAWTLFAAAAWVSGGAASAAPRELSALLFLPGAFAPGFVALWLTARAQGKAGVLVLLGRIFDPPVAARWYLFAVGYTAAIKLSAAVLHRVGTGAWSRFGDGPWYIIAWAIVLSTPVQAGEEVGWRGFALPRLAARLGLGPASLLLGAIWAFWHLPLFYVPAADTYGQSFPVYLLQVTALSVAMAWLYGHTNGSLLPVMLMHSAVNQTTVMVPSAAPLITNPLTAGGTLVGWLTALLLWICAAYFLARMPTWEVRSEHGSPASRSPAAGP